MHLLIYGGNGWIGSSFTNYLTKRGISHVLGKARVDDTRAVQQELVCVNPTHVMSLIGRTSGTYNGQKIGTIDYLEQPGILPINIRDNLYSPMVLALLCRERDIHYTYLGTGCIFNYSDDHPSLFTEEDEPNFIGSSYSIVKGYTDRLMHLFGDTVLNLRIRMPITADKNPRNFITKITGYEKICSIPNSMTVLEDFFPVWVSLMKNHVTGTINCTNPGVITHNEILEMYKELVDKNFTWENFTLEEQRKVLASDRSNNHLDTTTIEQCFPAVPNIKYAVRLILKKYC